MLPQLEAAASRGKLVENVMHFARLLRAAGMRVGPDRVIDCVKALEIAGTERRDDWYWTMSAVLLSRQEQRPIFDQAFRIFWRDPKLVEKMMNALLPKTYGRAGKEQEQSQRLSDALFDQKKAEQAREEQKSSWTRASPSPPRKCCSAWTSTPCRRRNSPRRRRCCATCACRCR